MLLFSPSAPAVELDERAALSINALAAGALSDTNAGLLMLDARTTVSRHVQAMIGPAVLVRTGLEPQHQLRMGATFQMNVGPVQLDDRNLWIWSAGEATRYRNRLRFTAPLRLRNRTVRLQLFHEAYYQHNGPGWFRNAVAFGGGLDLDAGLAADAYWMLTNTDGQRDSPMLLLIVAMRVG